MNMLIAKNNSMPITEPILTIEYNVTIALRIVKYFIISLSLSDFEKPYIIAKIIVNTASIVLITQSLWLIDRF